MNLSAFFNLAGFKLHGRLNGGVFPVLITILKRNKLIMQIMYQVTIAKKIDIKFQTREKLDLESEYKYFLQQD